MGWNEDALLALAELALPACVAFELDPPVLVGTPLAGDAVVALPGAGWPAPLDGLLEPREDDAPPLLDELEALLLATGDIDAAGVPCGP